MSDQTDQTPMRDIKNPFEHQFDPALSINAKFLAISAFAFSAWAIWPEDGFAWWQFRILSLILWGGVVLTAFGLVRQLYSVQKKRAAMQALEDLASPPKSARLMTAEDQRQAGMRDGQ